MIRDELNRALQVLGDRLPGGRFVVLVRRALGDRGVTFIRGDVEDVTGHPAGVFQAPTDTWAEIVHPEDRDTVLERLRSLPDAEELRLEYRIRDPSGGVRWLRENLRVRRAAPEAPPEVVGLLSDATFERTIQAKVAGLEKQLWRTGKLESVGTMAAGVAHDFNNLLTVILAAVDLLESEPDLPSDSMEDVGVIRQAAERGAELVRQILAFASRGPKEVATVDVAGLVGDLTPILDRAAGERIVLSVETEDEELEVEADPAHLEQIVFNLASNAWDAMPAGGTLGIRAAREVVEEPRVLERGRLRPSAYVRITVEDTGAGMDEEVRRRVFEPFFSTRDEEAERRGFGLSTVLRLVRGYGGAISVESDPGEGSAFHVFLPVREPARAEVSPARLRGEIESPGRGKARILLVEDEPAVRRVVARILEREGHTVVSAGSAGEGLQIFDRVRPPFDLLVTDVVLPDRSGHDLWRAATRRVPNLPVVFMSGYDRETVVREGVAVPDALILEKPVAPDEVTAAVDRALTGEEGDRPDDLPDAEEGGR